MAFKLELLDTCRLHPVFHASQLRKVVGQPDQVLPLPAALSDELEWVVEPLHVTKFRGEGKNMEVLISWKGLPDFEATWESAAVISQQFPEFKLEDKLNLLVGGNGKTPIITYQRRNRRTNGRVNSQQNSSPDKEVAEEDDVANTIMVDPTGISKGPTRDSYANPNLALTKSNSSPSIPISTTGTVGARQLGRKLEIQSRGRRY